MQRCGDGRSYFCDTLRRHRHSLGWRPSFERLAPESMLSPRRKAGSGMEALAVLARRVCFERARKREGAWAASVRPSAGAHGLQAAGE